ncbi:hypothetical protein AVEN_155723-1, partial [Araneus ventricosus]
AKLTNKSFLPDKRPGFLQFRDDLVQSFLEALWFHTPPLGVGGQEDVAVGHLEESKELSVHGG